MRVFWQDLCNQHHIWCSCSKAVLISLNVSTWKTNSQGHALWQVSLLHSNIPAWNYASYDVCNTFQGIPRTLNTAGDTAENKQSLWHILLLAQPANQVTSHDNPAPDCCIPLACACTCCCDHKRILSNDIQTGLVGILMQTYYFIIRHFLRQTSTLLAICRLCARSCGLSWTKQRRQQLRWCNKRYDFVSRLIVSEVWSFFTARPESLGMLLFTLWIAKLDSLCLFAIRKA